MSSFSVEVVELDDVLPHANADALEIAVIGGYHAIVGKGQFKKGDRAAYIPEAAIVPDDIIEHLGLTGRLSGSHKNRVKAIRLRGELSQGLVVSLSDMATLLQGERTLLFSELYPNNITLDGTTPATEAFESVIQDFVAAPPIGWTEIVWEVGMDLQFIYNIFKWEPSIPANLRGKATNRPTWWPKYDIENYKKYNRAFDDGEEVIITEKLHGTNASYAMRREDRKLMVVSRNWVLEHESDKTYYQQNVYWQIAESEHLESVLNRLLDKTQAETVIVFGEILGSGVQDLTYGVDAGKQLFRVFDILVDGRYLDYDEQLDVLTERRTYIAGVVDVVHYLLPTVPLVYRGSFSDAIVQEHTDGNTTVTDKKQIREGIVLRPVKERTSGRLGRVILKNVSGDYLTRKNGTEYQ